LCGGLGGRRIGSGSRCILLVDDEEEEEEEEEKKKEVVLDVGIRDISNSAAW